MSALSRPSLAYLALFFALFPFLFLFISVSPSISLSSTRLLNAFNESFIFSLRVIWFSFSRWGLIGLFICSSHHFFFCVLFIHFFSYLSFVHLSICRSFQTKHQSIFMYPLFFFFVTHSKTGISHCFSISDLFLLHILHFFSHQLFSHCSIVPLFFFNTLRISFSILSHSAPSSKQEVFAVKCCLDILTQ